MNISLFKNSFADEPEDTLTFSKFIEGIKEGTWRKQVEKLRAKLDNETAFKRIKKTLPAVTVSGEYITRSKFTPMHERLKAHSGLICLDIDKKDNPKMRAHDLVDKECYAQFTSCSGEGIKIVYKCQTTKDRAEHRRIYDAAIDRLQKKGVILKADPIVKSIASLQYVSYDDKAYYFPKSKLVIKPLPAPKVKVSKPSEDALKDLEELQEYIEALGSKDVSSSYEDWLNIAFGLSYTLGEHGRKPFHELSKNYEGYSSVECDEMYDSCLERSTNNDVDKPVTIASVFQVIIDSLPKAKARALAKKYNKSHAVGIGEDVEQGDLSGMVRYRLFLFKKIIDKETGDIVELVPHGINLNAFDELLSAQQFYKYEKGFVHIKSNIVSTVEVSDILHIVTKLIEAEGDYKFTYSKTEFFFSWEELAHLWRTIRAQSTTYNQVTASLQHWKPNLLKDKVDESYIPYRNGVAVVNKKTIKLVPYEEITMQIWKERILPRDFKHTTKKGMFEVFFENVCGRGDTSKKRTASETYKRAVWYFGYILQGTKRQSTARAWLLYDIRNGNNGRTGKTIIGQAVGKIRNMVVIDGKQVDFKNRFAFQTVQPWTDVVFIDDPSKYMSLQPLFNMITGEINADRKGLLPVVLPVKFLIASNWVLEAEGNSEAGRQFVTQLDDFYVRWGKEHNDTITPIVDFHGKEFFTDWTDTDWNQFDSFSLKCIQEHLKVDAPSNTIIGNALMIRFIQLHESEMFFELSLTLCTHVKSAKGGGLLIPQQLLISIIKDCDAKTTSIKAGKIAREYLRAIGAKDVEITSIVVGGMNRMAYKLNNQFKDLEFGEFSKRLPKPTL